MLDERTCHEAVADALLIALASANYKGPIVEVRASSDFPTLGIRDPEDGKTRYVQVLLEPVEDPPRPPRPPRAQAAPGAPDASPEADPESIEAPGAAQDDATGENEREEG